MSVSLPPHFSGTLAGNLPVIIEGKEIGHGENVRFEITKVVREHNIHGYYTAVRYKVTNHYAAGDSTWHELDICMIGSKQNLICANTTDEPQKIGPSQTREDWYYISYDFSEEAEVLLMTCFRNDECQTFGPISIKEDDQ